MNHSYLFACVGLWNGLILENASKLRSSNFTIIEDANEAIQAKNIFAANLRINNTTFNRCIKGIVLTGNPSSLSHPKITDFKNNYFTCTSPTNNGKITEVGLEINDVFFPLTNNISLNSTNKFIGIKNGIIVNGNTTNLHIHHFTFDKIKEKGISFSGNYLTVKSECLFDNILKYGIFYNRGKLLDVQHSHFFIRQVPSNNVIFDKEMISINDFGIDSKINISSGNTFVLEGDQKTSSNRGIKLAPSSINIVNILILDNYFDFKSSGNASYDDNIGIYSFGMFNDASTIQIFYNEFHCTNSNWTGIFYYVSNTSNLKILSNYFYDSSIIIDLNEGMGNEISDNYFYYANGGVFNFGPAIDLTFTKNLKICNNHIYDSNSWGITFAYQNLGADVTLNEIYGCYYGELQLRLIDFVSPQIPAIIGPQTHRGNKFYPTLVIRKVKNESVDPQVIELSKFIVHTNQSVYNPISRLYDYFSEYHPAVQEVIPDQGIFEDVFFVKDPNGGQPNQACVALANEYQESILDLLIAQDSLGSNVFPYPALKWESKRYLYQKLLNNIVLLNSNINYQNFVNDQMNTNIGGFYEIEKLIHNTYKITDSINLILNNLIYLKDSLDVITEYTNEPDTLTESIINYKLLISIEINNLYTYIENEIKSDLQQLQTSLNLVNSAEIYETYRKNALNLYLLSAINDTLQMSEIQEVKNIVSQCYYESGYAPSIVYSLLNPCQIFELNNQECEYNGGSNLLSKINDKKQMYIEIYPNPSRGNAVINNKTTLKLNLKVLNISGKMVYREKLNKSINNFYFNLPSGLYFMVINDDHGNYKEVHKLIIE